MDSERAKRFKWFNRFWNVMSSITMVVGIITATLTAFTLWTGDWTTGGMGLFLVAVAIVLTALTRSMAKDAKELFQQSRPQ